MVIVQPMGILQLPLGKVFHEHVLEFPELKISLFVRQRFVSIPSDSQLNPSSISVLDFNPYNVARFSMEENTSDGGTQRPIKLFKTSEELDQSVFAEPVHSSLPYIETQSSESYNYTAVLMDEERILGLHVRSFNFLFEL